jgi:hypothetical protein
MEGGRLGVVVEVHCLFSQEVIFKEIIGHVVEVAGGGKSREGGGEERRRGRRKRGG